MKKVLQKAISDSGYCSRRKAQRLIEKGEVKVNGTIAEPGLKVDDEDEITVEDQTLSFGEEPVYIKLNKPKGYVCTNRKFRNEKSVMELIDIEQRIFVAGRLDKNSRGLVLLSNDGNWTYKLTHPSFEHEKEYRITLERELEEEECEKLTENGVDIGEDEPVFFKTIRSVGKAKYKTVLTQGKNRQIRRMFQELGIKVKELKRKRIGKYTLGDLKEGEWELIK